MDVVRAYCANDPVGHGRETDAVVFWFYARASGNLELDGLHGQPRIVTPDEFREKRGSFHPYVQDMMDLALPHFSTA